MKSIASSTPIKKRTQSKELKHRAIHQNGNWLDFMSKNNSSKRHYRNKFRVDWSIAFSIATSLIKSRKLITNNNWKKRERNLRREIRFSTKFVDKIYIKRNYVLYKATITESVGVEFVGYFSIKFNVDFPAFVRSVVKYWNTIVELKICQTFQFKLQKIYIKNYIISRQYCKISSTEQQHHTHSTYTNII